MTRKAPKACDCGSHAWAPLTKGFATIVDLADIGLLERSHHAHVVGHLVYARANDKSLLHRVITGAPEEKLADHINGCGLDNRRGNLRVCSKRENSINRSKRRGTQKNYKGVHRHRNSWQAFISVDGKSSFIGSFKTESEAAAAYNERAVTLFGEFARLNEISQSAA